MIDSESTPSVRIQLLYVAECPLLDVVRTRAQQCLRRSRIAVEIEEIEGDYPSPTLVVDGIDVLTGEPPAGHPCCRLDTPTTTQIDAALHDAIGARPGRPRAC